MQIEPNVSGGLTVRVPVEVSLPPTKLRPVAQQLRSIDFDLSQGDTFTFTFSLPVFWALMLAGPDLRRNFRNLLIGAGLTAAVELALLLAFAQITGIEQATQLAGGKTRVSAIGCASSERTLW